MVDLRACVLRAPASRRSRLRARSTVLRTVKTTTGQRSAGKNEEYHTGNRHTGWAGQHRRSGFTGRWRVSGTLVRRRRLCPVGKVTGAEREDDLRILYHRNMVHCRTLGCMPEPCHRQQTDENHESGISVGAAHSVCSRVQFERTPTGPGHSQHHRPDSGISPENR